MNIHNKSMSATDELKANVNLPFDHAKAMPTSVYTSEEFYQHEIEHIFKKDWFCAGRAETLPDIGDYLTLELAGQPVMVIRDKNNEIRAQSNVCLHRMSTLLEGTGNTKAIVCPYHAWTYSLDGSMRGAPAMGRNQAFCKDKMILPQIRCEIWLGWIMISLNPNANPVASELGEAANMIEDFDMASYQQTFSEIHVWDTNWKVLAENFMESYHLPVCHSGTIGWSVDLEKMDCPTSPPSFNYHTILKDPEFKLSVAHPNNTKLVDERRITTYLISIYPSLMITLTPGYFWYLSLHPLGPDKVHIVYGGGMSPDFANDPEGEAMLSTTKSLLDDVNMEDKGCTEKVYKGLSSGLAVPGPLSHLERPNFDFAKYIASRVCK
jgi:phenylpropionate dioxygenase-like ring-hydroxylating dioxygenase large terminal subunit